MSDNTNNKINQHIQQAIDHFGNGLLCVFKAYAEMLEAVTPTLLSIAELITRTQTSSPRVYHLANNAKKARTRKKNLRRIEREGNK